MVLCSLCWVMECRCICSGSYLSQMWFSCYLDVPSCRQYNMLVGSCTCCWCLTLLCLFHSLCGQTWFKYHESILIANPCVLCGGSQVFGRKKVLRLRLRWRRRGQSQQHWLREASLTEAEASTARPSVIRLRETWELRAVAWRWFPCDSPLFIVLNHGMQMYLLW
jgi:hypothetical protein